MDYNETELIFLQNRYEVLLQMYLQVNPSATRNSVNVDTWHGAKMAIDIQKRQYIADQIAAATKRAAAEREAIASMQMLSQPSK